MYNLPEDIKGEKTGEKDKLVLYDWFNACNKHVFRLLKKVKLKLNLDPFIRYSKRTISSLN